MVSHDNHEPLSALERKQRIQALEESIRAGNAEPSAKAAPSSNAVSPKKSRKGMIACLLLLAIAGGFAAVKWFAAPAGTTPLFAKKTPSIALSMPTHSTIYLYGTSAFAIRADGTVYSHEVGFGGPVPGVDEWTDIVQIDYSGQDAHAVGLKADGTVVVSCLDDRFCRGEDCDTSGWKNIVDVCVSNSTVYGLRSDGTLVHTDLNKYIAEVIDQWENVVNVEVTSGGVVVAQHADGTLLISSDHFPQFRQLSDVKSMQICARLLAVTESGESHSSQLSSYTYQAHSGFAAKKYVYVDTGVQGHVLGLHENGTVVWGEEFAARESKELENEISAWTDLVDLAAYDIVAGVQSDGTLLFSTQYCPYSDVLRTWTGLKVPAR